MRTTPCFCNLVTFLTLTVSALTTATTVHATVFEYEGTAAVSEVQNTTEAVLGDVYTFQFSYDDSPLDTNPSTNVGVFTDALINLSVAAAPGNTGSFDPATLAYTPISFNTVNDIVNPPLVDGIAAISQITGSVGGEALREVDLILSSTTLSLFSDSGSGQTLGQITGGPIPANLGVWDNAAFLRFEPLGEGENQVEILANLTSLRLIPEPTSLALLGLGTLTLATRPRNPRRAAG